MAHVIIKTDKIQIVHFRTQCHSRTQYVFKYGDYDIKLVRLYKYLGLVLNEHLDWPRWQNQLIECWDS